MDYIDEFDFETRLKSLISNASKSREDSSRSIPRLQFDEEVLLKNYTNLVESINLAGYYQKVIFFILILTSLNSCLMVLVLGLHKDLPDLFCYNKHTFLDDPFDVYKKFKNNTQFDIIYDEACIDLYCEGASENKGFSILVVDNYSKMNFITKLKVLCYNESFFNKFAMIGFIGKTILPSLLSYFTDRYGRFPMYYFNIISIIFGYIILFFTKDITTTYIVGFCLFGLFQQTYLCGLIGSEFMNKNYSHLLTGVNAAAFSIEGAFAVAFMYFFENWDVLLIVNIASLIFALLLSIKYIRETPPWLLSEKRYRQLEAETLVVAKFNKTEDEYYRVLNIINKTKINHEEYFEAIATKEGFISNFFGPYIPLFGTKLMIINMSKLTVIFVSSNIIYFGIILNVEKLGEKNIHRNLLMIFAGEIVSEIAAGVILQKFQIKQILYFGYGITAITCYLCVFIEEPILLLVAAFTISLAFVACWSHVLENFDPNVKSSVLSMLMNFGSLGVAMSPYLIQIFPTAFTLFGTLSIVSLGFSYLLEVKKK